MGMLIGLTKSNSLGLVHPNYNLGPGWPETAGLLVNWLVNL